MLSKTLRLGSVRGLATAAASHQPPLKVHGIVGRYAGAVYTAASKAGALDKVESELLAFNEALKKSPNFASFIANPTIPRDQKTASVGAVLDEKKFSHISRNLFMTMCANGKIQDAPKVISAYADMMSTGRGVVNAVITSAEPLNKKTLETLQKAVTATAGKGKTVALTTVVDPNILGGLQVMIGDTFLDLSVQKRIADVSSVL